MKVSNKFPKAEETREILATFKILKRKTVLYCLRERICEMPLICHMAADWPSENKKKHLVQDPDCITVEKQRCSIHSEAH